MTAAAVQGDMMTLSARKLAPWFVAGWMLSTAMPAAAQTSGAAGTGSAAIFRFETDEFWLNLHHFLYVLGRAEAKEQDASREAVAGAPADAEKGLASLSDAERQTWHAAVTAYASGLSKKNAIFDAPLPALTTALGRARDAATLANQPDAAGALDAPTRATLEDVAPIYRRVWWPAHRASNQAWRTATQSLVDRHGRAILDFLTKAYGQPWPADGYAVHLSMYANWAGAYSTEGRLLMVATNSGAGTSGLDGLETVFHEGMHQWDDGMLANLLELGKANQVPVPPNLWHGLIFFTAGEAVKRVAPSHVPYAEAYGVWNRGMRLIKPPIEDAWKAYLDGPTLGDKTARDAALLAVLKKTPPTLPASPR
jgi:hypothetical protein